MRHGLASDNAWQTRFHRPHAQERRELVATLLRAADSEELDMAEPLEAASPSRKLAGKLCGCGKHPVIWRKPDGRLVQTSARCRSRICPTCAPLRTRELETRVREAVRNIDDARLLTLTIAATADPLVDQIARLRSAFTKLRRRKEWKRHVKGGIAIFEVTWSKKLQRWHPHLHVVIDGVYWPQKQIANEWERATGDSRICDIRRVPSREVLVRYVAKYVSKSQTPGNLPDARMVEWCHAVHGLRMAQTFGSLHGRKVDCDETEKEGACELVVSMSKLAEACEDNCMRARRLMRALRLVLRSDDLVAHQRLGSKLEHYQRHGPGPPVRDRPWKHPPPPPQLALYAVD